MLFVVSLFAELIANDRPMLVSYKGEFYMPIFEAYPETTFGGIFETEADYRDPAVQEHDRGERLDAVAADPLLLQHQNKNPPMACPVKPTWLLTTRTASSRSSAASILHATSNGTGSAPTTRAATWSRA